jgi:hypothetical protein
MLETERLIVREWTASEEDIARRFDTYRREEVVKWLANATPLASIDQAVASQARAETIYAAHEGRYGVWAVQVRDSGIVAGSVLLVPMPMPPMAATARGRSKSAGIFTPTRGAAVTPQRRQKPCWITDLSSAWRRFWLLPSPITRPPSR